jgi:CheY-like chemotaxis protein
MIADQELGGRRVLIVEDEALIAGLIEKILGDAGCTVIGPVASAKHALNIIEQGPIDAVLLDISAGDEEAYPVADLLADRGIPFMFVSGYAQRDMPVKYRQYAYISKPFEPAEMLALLGKAIQARGAGPARPG